MEQTGAKDMVRGSSFYVLSFSDEGDERRFEIADLIDGKVTDTIFSEKMASGSLLKVDAATNARYWHWLPKDPAWRGRVRYSLIYRTIKRGKVRRLIEWLHGRRLHLHPQRRPGPQSRGLGGYAQGDLHRRARRGARGACDVRGAPRWP